MILSSLYIAPSAPPTSVSVSKVTYSSITVQWGPVDCIHRNGGIRGYSVRLSEVVGEIFIDVSGEKNTRVTISGLVPSTDYNIQIAAVNSAGIGSYSTPIQAETYGKKPFQILLILLLIHNISRYRSLVSVGWLSI